VLERRGGRPIRLRLGANESAFGPSPRAIEVMREAARKVSWYGDPESHDLRAALAERHHVGIKNILVGNGIDGILGLIARVTVEPGVSVATTAGSYPTFGYHVFGFGGTLKCVPYKDDAIDCNALAASAKAANARLVYVANPDNPSGTWRSAADINALRDELPRSCLLTLDEAYADFAPSEALPEMDVDDACLARVRTFSKAHGLAGGRVGYLIAHADLIEAIGKVRNQFEVSRLSQMAALASLAVAKGRAEYEALAHDLGFSTIPSTTNFVCMDVGGEARARAILDLLLERGVFIRMPGAPPLNRCIRVTVGVPEGRALFADELRQVLRQL
jgi:histidinol-phosphate aminotransferase